MLTPARSWMSLCLLKYWRWAKGTDGVLYLRWTIGSPWLVQLTESSGASWLFFKNNEFLPKSPAVVHGKLSYFAKRNPVIQYFQMSEWYFLIHAYFASTNSLQYLIRWSRSACDPCWFSMDLQMKLHCSSWLHVWPRGAPPICGTHCDICIQRSDFVSRTLQRLTCQVWKVRCFPERVKAG